jgi:hypothetical protein
MKISIVEKEMILLGLSMQKNYIETHDVLLSAQDAMNMNKKGIIRVLDSDQYRKIIALEDLIKKIE